MGQIPWKLTRISHHGGYKTKSWTTIISPEGDTAYQYHAGPGLRRMARHHLLVKRMLGVFQLSNQQLLEPVAAQPMPASAALLLSVRRFDIGLSHYSTLGCRVQNRHLNQPVPRGHGPLHELRISRTRTRSRKEINNHDHEARRELLKKSLRRQSSWAHRGCIKLNSQTFR